MNGAFFDDNIIFNKYCGRMPDRDENRKIKEADRILLLTEKRDLMVSGLDWGYGDDIPLMEETIKPLNFEESKELFIQEFLEAHTYYYAMP